MKQKMNRALWMLVCLMAMVSANAETIVTVDGLQYSLNGAYASVYMVAEGNTSTTITIPSIITKDGLTYTVTEIMDYAFWYNNPSSDIPQSNQRYHNNRIDMWKILFYLIRLDGVSLVLSVIIILKA